MRDTHVAVIRGGLSEEFDVSLRSGEHVLATLRQHYKPIDIVIAKNGEWLRHGRARTPHEALTGVDMVLNALHGSYGEDGTIQRILERHGVPYTGSDSYASAIAMHKAITKDHLRHQSIKLAKHILLTNELISHTKNVAQSVIRTLGEQVVLKPVMSGSSVGVRVTRNEGELKDVLDLMLTQYAQVLAEEFLEGREATVGVINGFRNHDVYVLPPAEIISPEGALFDYEGKYSDASAHREVCPSYFANDTKDELIRLARMVHTVLGLRHYSRSDFRVTPKGIYFLEVNTLPGLTTASLMPKMLIAVGSSMGEFTDHILTQARNDHVARV
jgi:D-alanine-D-alanine ligase